MINSHVFPISSGDYVSLHLLIYWIAGDAFTTDLGANTS